MKNLVFFAIMFVIFGCASRYSNLSKEHDKISLEIEALNEEQKAVKNTEEVAERYLKVRSEYLDKIKELETIQKQNNLNGISSEFKVDKSMEIDEMIKKLKEVQSIISDRIRELEKRRSEIVKEQTDIETGK